MQKQHPKNAAGYLLDAQLNLRLKDTDAAITAYRAGLQQTQDPRIAIALHSTLVKTGKRAEAESMAASWERDHPDNADFDMHLASTAFVAGNLAQAETRLRRVVAKQPDNARALNNLAVVLLDLGKSGARPFAEKANVLIPDQPVFMYALARALAAENQLPRALEIQKKAIERAPEDMSMRVALAQMAIQSGDRALARAELEKVARQGKRYNKQEEVANLLKTL
jgi:Flp pilus assembly protein TadD